MAAMGIAFHWNSSFDGEFGQIGTWRLPVEQLKLWPIEGVALKLAVRILEPKFIKMILCVDYGLLSN
jgi:hypothetical protein